ncbi:MAG: MogA/MoaB family molybdenum cofactor biosynthesis protein [Methanocorpusculum parvum]|nr:MogA/MoaB family molybdenum cofactor biosynthesis protein [Methanocorpusculum parvum]
MGHEHHRDIPVQAAVITVSTSRTEKTDLSGQIIREAFENAGMAVVFQTLVPDVEEQISSAVLAALESANCVVVTGGTGLTSDDCTIEAVSPLFDKTMDGFGELFRWKSYEQVKTAVLLSRATAGLVKGSAVFCIPGSPKAVKLASEEIIVPEIKHILTHAGQ